MKKLYFPVSVIITTYGSVLLLLAFFFLMRDSNLYKLQSAVPFIVRFCAFWFLSVLLAIIFFLINLNVNYFSDSQPDRLRARWAGLLAFATAAVGTVLAVVGIFFFQL